MHPILFKPLSAFCCYAAFSGAAGLSRHVAENAEFEQVLLNVRIETATALKSVVRRQAHGGNGE
jgi:hypothetical protein